MLLSLFLLFITLLIASRWHFRRRSVKRSAAIVVLGDFGRSPRMMYHTQSFAENDFETYVIAYQGSTVIPSLRKSPRVHFVYLPEPPAFISKLSPRFFILLAPFKIIFQISVILVALLFRLDQSPSFILLQNPPSIPTLPLVQLVSWIRNSKLIIDWHNLGYSILALKLGSHHPLVFFAKRLEMLCGRSAYAHLFVTSAMRNQLVAQWYLQGKKIVLYDRPPSQFHRCLPSETHNLFVQLIDSIQPSVNDIFPHYSVPTSTPFTHASPHPLSSHSLREDRPALIVSSTSWSEDEDFNILLTALRNYEHSVRERNDLPNALFMITGKGPLKSFYMNKILDLESTENWQHVRCRSIWLEPEHYPVLLGSADLGICLHASSSALDLPMKVVDMFGCSLPVLALDFKCLPELVINGKNGLVFQTADDLTNLLVMTLKNFPTAEKLQAMRAFFDNPNAEWDWCSWRENWSRVLLPIVAN
ncbi:hypothetical protein Clacol_003619 [Clathrus columnatus]|uniref:Chitobiosyldiphosphodolichol beta-mannosyltransferase n=1 Tax=Clathrus columnatus TaxID=1419009 RepID=A0AAV5A6V4_9AGAM|nr:hypothetical protein Clacol_003619 [Clathrus columnatus]